MSKLCSKCHKSIPNLSLVNGRKVNTQRRKYCFDCSPFGYHNTVRLEQKKRNAENKVLCDYCNKPLSDSQKKGRKCWTCQYNKRSQKRLDEMYAMVGEACWKCSYNKGRRMLDFHHIDPLTKLFNLDSRCMTNYAKDQVITEMKKCALLCCRCHREYHAGFISQVEMDVIYTRGWNIYGSLITSGNS